MTTSQRLTESDLDQAIRTTQEKSSDRQGDAAPTACGANCAQGRNHECQTDGMPELRGWYLLLCAVVAGLAVAASALWPLGVAP